MKLKILKFRFMLEVLLSIVLILIYMFEISGRHVLCFSNGKCVTTWETIGGHYIIPYKYYGLAIPNEYILTLDSGAGGYGSLIYLAKNISSEFVVDSTRTQNYSKQKIYTRTYNGYESTEEIKSKIQDNEYFMINTGTEFVGHGTIIERWKGTKKETVVEPFFFFQNAYIPIYIVFCTVFFFRYITKASVVTNSAQPIKSIVIWSLKIVAETVIVIITIIGTIILLFLIMQYLFTG
jgi:hypothetical protein